MSGGLDTDKVGFVMGGDYVNSTGNWLFGAASSYSDGDTDSVGDWVSTSSETESVGVHIYGLWTPSDRFNVSGSLAFQWSDADITQGLGGVAGFSKAEADVSVRSFSAALRAEYRQPVADNVAVVPHAGVRYVRTNGGSYSTRVDGEGAFHNTTRAADTFQLPVGVGVRGDFASQGGWYFRGSVDAGYVAQFGDRKASAVVSTPLASDTVTGKFAGKGAAKLDLDLEARKGNTSFGLSYVMTDGSGKSGHSLGAGFRYRF